MTAELPPGSVVVIDTSVLIALGKPDNEKFQRFEEHVTENEITVRVPGYVAEELGDAPEDYQYQRERLRAARDAGWLTSVAVDFENPEVSDIVDRTRERMAALAADDISADEIEKTDTVLAGVACQLAGTQQGVGVLVSDALAAEAIGDVLAAAGHGDIAVVDGREFISELVDTGV